MICDNCSSAPGTNKRATLLLCNSCVYRYDESKRREVLKLRAAQEIERYKRISDTKMFLERCYRLEPT